tara:strand:+ start:129 stop:350 length:222 start_codon:yes stop_codon:yes gene_type:complete
MLAGPRVITQTITEVERITVKDPNGLIRHDLLQIQKWLPDTRYKAGDTLEEVAQRQGMHDLFEIINRKIVGKR